jgi:hypothetical protein
MEGGGEEVKQRKVQRNSREQLHDLYSSSDITRVMRSTTTRWERHVTHMAEKKNAHTNFGGEI